MFDDTKETAHQEVKRDRKLGDEWSGWNGDTGNEDIDEKLSVFLSLASVILLVFISLFLLGWYMIKPRVEQVNPFLAHAAGSFIIAFSAVLFISVIIEGVLLLTFRRSLFPYKWVEKLLLSLLPGAIWLGGKLGISRDRTGNSFIKLHNFITRRSFSGRLRAERILVLLPRCLRKEARNEINSRVKGNSFKIHTAAGGEEAREVIKQFRPTCILAIACERDLMSGLKDVAEKIPVLAIANKRPEGPCKNTDFSIAELEEALKALNNGKVLDQMEVI